MMGQMLTQRFETISQSRDDWNILWLFQSLEAATSGSFAGNQKW